jgi:hypothetical protein
MLHAILLNKAGRNLSNSEVHWRELFAASEDSLTSTIFGNLFHLPVELFWQILNNSCYSESLTTQNPKILSVDFWPHWSAEDSYNTNFVEPDIFIRTTDFDLIIEAKRYDDNQQSTGQWKNEFQGYLNEYGKEEKKVILLAVGGISNEEPEDIIFHEKKMWVLKCRWMKILQEVKSIQAKLEKNQGYLNNVDSTLVILNDTILGFGIHGYATGSWIEDEDFSKLTPISSYNLISSLAFQI